MAVPYAFNFDRWWVCERKNRYASRQRAEEAADATGAEIVRAYRCPYDPDHWHIGRDVHAMKREPVKVRLDRAKVRAARDGVRE